MLIELLGLKAQHRIKLAVSLIFGHHLIWSVKINLSKISDLNADLLQLTTQFLDDLLDLLAVALELPLELLFEFLVHLLAEHRNI